MASTSSIIVYAVVVAVYAVVFIAIRAWIEMRIRRGKISSLEQQQRGRRLGDSVDLKESERNRRGVGSEGS